MRIPRPTGITGKALKGESGNVYEILSRKFLQGEFPFGVSNLSMVDFSLKYKIPLKHIHEVVKNGIQEESLLGDSNLYEKLNKMRFNLLDSTIFNYGASTAKTYRLITYLERRIYENDRTHPSLIRELNVALGNSHKGTDSASKVLTLLNEALSTVEPQSTTEKTLDRTEILRILNDLKPDMAGMFEEVKDAPTLGPVGTAGGVSTVPLRKVNGDYTKAKELKQAMIPEELLTIPI